MLTFELDIMSALVVASPLPNRNGAFSRSKTRKRSSVAWTTSWIWPTMIIATRLSKSKLPVLMYLLVAAVVAEGERAIVDHLHEALRAASMLNVRPARRSGGGPVEAVAVADERNQNRSRRTGAAQIGPAHRRCRSIRTIPDCSCTCSTTISRPSGEMSKSRTTNSGPKLVN